MRKKRHAIILSLALALGVSVVVTYFWLWRSIEGVYVFRSSEVEEILELKPGGQFIQRIKIGDAIYSATGQWSLESRDVTFRSSFFMRFDCVAGTIRNPPIELSFGQAYWDARHDRISFDGDCDQEYFVKKVR